MLARTGTIAVAIGMAVAVGAVGGTAATGKTVPKSAVADAAAIIHNTFTIPAGNARIPRAWRISDAIAVRELKVTASPASGRARPGGVVRTTVTATGGRGTVTFSAGATGLRLAPFFNPPSVATGGSATMVVFAPLERGTYRIRIHGTDSVGATGSTEYWVTVG